MKAFEEPNELKEEDAFKPNDVRKSIMRSTFPFAQVNCASLASSSYT